MILQIDLHDYNSPIKRSDGQVPYNGYLWPTEDWWPGQQPEFRNRVGSRWHFGIVALDDGRFATDGTVWFIKHNTDHPMPRKGEPTGLPVVFASRVAAIRTAAARMISRLLASRHWSTTGSFDRMDRETMTAVINWTLAQVATACKAAPPALVALPEPPAPPPPRPEAGLPLFDMKPNARHHAEATKEPIA